MQKPPPHDALFKLLTSDLTIATEIVRERLPTPYRNALVGQVRHTTPNLIQHPTLKRLQPDCLLQATLRLRRRSLLAYLPLEHKSSPAPGTPLQLARYALATWEAVARTSHKPPKQPPLVLPMLFYHGRAPWKLPTRHGTTLPAPATQAPYGMALHWIATNLGQLPVSQLSRHPYANLVFHAMLYLSGKVGGDWHLRSICRQLPDAELRSGPVIEYLLRGGVPKAVMDATINKVKPKQGAIIMDKALQLLEAESEAKGRAEGRAEGQAHLVLRLLEHRFTDLPPSAHNRLAQASPAELEAWFVTALEAPSLEAVFQAKPKVH